MTNILQDVRYGFRMLRKNPGFTAVAVVTLALGIGANTAIFSVVNGVLLKPLPYASPDRLVRVFESSTGQPRFPMSPGNFLDYRDQNSVFEQFALFTRDDLELSLGERPERLSAMRVSAGFFETLGVRPLLGREFSREDEVPENKGVAVLSYGIWQRRFGGDPDIVGKGITLSGNPFMVVGVLPSGVQHVGGDYRSLPHGDSVDVWWPMSLSSKSPRFAHFVNTLGRMKPGVTREQAEADFNIEGRAFSETQGPSARYHFITPDYFRTIGVPLIAGRWFDSHDIHQASQVVLINQSMARRYWADEDAVGKRITFNDQPKEDDWLTIAGVVGDVKDYPNSAEAEPAFYWPEAQQPNRDLFLAIRTTGNPMALTEAVQREVRTLDKDLAVSEIKALDTIAEAGLARQRFTVLMVGLFAGIALTLAAIGIYGVMSYLVAQRTHEMGIRLALGARQRSLMTLILGQGMLLAGSGVAIGLAGSFALTRLMAGLLYGVSTTDLMTFLLIAALLAGVALLACYIPARRASTVDPMVALRYE